MKGSAVQNVIAIVKNLQEVPRGYALKETIGMERKTIHALDVSTNFVMRRTVLVLY